MPFRRRRHREPEPPQREVLDLQDAQHWSQPVEDPEWPEDPDDPVVRLRRRLEERLEELEFTLEELASQVRGIDQRVTDLEEG